MDCTASLPPVERSISPGLLRLLRLEGFAVAVLGAILYAHTGASWWIFAALWLVPDLSMLGYVAGSRWGAYTYNCFHCYVGPAALVCLALLLSKSAWLAYAYLWFNHIGVDRMLGYGLKSITGFGDTHLKQMNSRRLGQRNLLDQ